MLHQLVESVEVFVDAVNHVASFVIILETELRGISGVGSDAEQLRIWHWKIMTGMAHTVMQSLLPWSLQLKVISSL
jgi:hypothetical protein